jgi:hypothetical protein
MEASPTTLNPIQMQLLRMFSYEKDEHNLKEIQKLLFDYYCNKVEEEVEKVWIEKNMTNEMMQEFKNAHFGTPYINK